MTIILAMMDTILRNNGTIVLAMVWWAASYWITWTCTWKSQYYELADLRFNHWLQLSDSISLQLWTKNNRFQFRYHNISLNHPKKWTPFFPAFFPQQRAFVNNAEVPTKAVGHHLATMRDVKATFVPHLAGLGAPTPLA